LRTALSKKSLALQRPLVRRFEISKEELQKNTVTSYERPYTLQSVLNQEARKYACASQYF